MEVATTGTLVTTHSSSPDSRRTARMVPCLPSESSSSPTLGLYFLPLTEVELGNPSIKHCGVRRLKGSLHHISIILSMEKEASYYIGRV